MLHITKDWKHFRSENFNYSFNMKNGFMGTWGAKKEDNPDSAPFPLILDIEISEKCHGINGVVCPYCYKGNSASAGRNMSLQEFKTILDKMA